MLCIAAADIKPVIVERAFEVVDRLTQELVPLLFTLLRHRAMPQFFLVSFALVEGLMPQFEMDTTAVDEEHRAESGSERDHEFQSLPTHSSKSLHVSVVRHPHRTAELLLQLLSDVETAPSFVQIYGCIHDTLIDYARKADGDAVETVLHFRKLANNADHRLGRRFFRSGSPRALAYRLAILVQRDGFDAGAADIDSERTHRLAAYTLHAGIGSILTLRHGFLISGHVGEIDALCGDDAFVLFQAEDGIRDPLVTEVQTCALPI